MNEEEYDENDDPTHPTDGKEIVRISGMWTKATPLMDGTVSCGFKTQQELSEDDFVVLAKAVKKQSKGWFIYIGNDADPAGVSIPKEQAPERNQKTKSERLRNVIFRVYEARKKPHGDSDAGFNLFYSEIMEDLISNFKTELAPREEEW